MLLKNFEIWGILLLQPWIFIKLTTLLLKTRRDICVTMGKLSITYST